MFRQLLFSSRICPKKSLLESTAQNVEGCFSKPGVPSRTPSSITQAFHTSSVLDFGRKQRKVSGSTFEPKSDTVDGEKSSILETRNTRFDDRFPDLHLPTKVYNGTMFKDLPIVNVKATMNNTIMNVTDKDGLTMMIRSCGYDGFKNARKGTNVAAQATAFTLGKRMVQRGLKTVRARVQGLGAGRLASLKGLTIAGVQIVSITDNTPVSWNPPRARKERRL